MTILIVSDLHYEKNWHHGVWEGETLKWLLSIIDQHKPTDLVSCGDSGYAWDEEEWETLIEKVRLHLIYGNHDNVNMMRGLRNVDRSSVCAKDGEVRVIQGLKFGFINGIIGGEKEVRRRKKFREVYKGHMTDITWVPRHLALEYLAYADILSHQNIDVLCTHASVPFPSDGKKFHPTEEFQTVTEAIFLIKPRISFSGHLSGPYALNTIPDTTLIRIDSSPQERHYALLDGNTILIYHDREVVERVEYNGNIKKLDNR